ncbi:unnamed protein product [Dracunculus medinensis]|uniref:Vesicle transport protein USE1 n=1 Tax=Dracunculus medinensis TaxID=318479 RepID=A0A0N4UA24_DRAME|nr:unnamed protein product [Dracunculus medinensis]
MGVVTVDEINFQRLLDRSKRLCGENLVENVFKLKAALIELEAIFSRLQDDRNLDTDLLMQYGRDMHQLKLLVEAEQKKTPEERLRWIDMLPSVFPPFNPSTSLSDDCNESRFAFTNGNSNSNSIEGLKAKNKAVYRADLPIIILLLLRLFIQQLSENVNLDEVIRAENEKQEKLAKDLLEMAILMKQTYTTASVVLQDDNTVLSRLQKAAETNKMKLEIESRRLEEHAYRSWCDCMYLIGIFIIISSFISMVIVMKMFSKKY